MLHCSRGTQCLCWYGPARRTGTSEKLQNVIVISLDFSKAFDTVRHATPLQKFTQLNIPHRVAHRVWLLQKQSSYSKDKHRILHKQQPEGLCGLRVREVTDLLLSRWFQVSRESIHWRCIDYFLRQTVPAVDNTQREEAHTKIPDAVYNWLADYFTGHSHCTKYGRSTSSLCQISASIVQGSAIGPVSYVINASDLRAATPGNELCKYADDTYVIIPAANERSRCSEWCDTKCTKWGNLAWLGGTQGHRHCHRSKERIRISIPL